MGLNWSRPLTGTFLGVFIIVYGQIQSWCPQLVLGPLKQAPANKYVAMLWAGILLLVPLGLGPTILTSPPFQEHDTTVMSAILIVRSACALHTYPLLTRPWACAFSSCFSNLGVYGCASTDGSKHMHSSST